MSPSPAGPATVKEEFPLWAMAVLGVLLAVAVLLPTTLFVVRRVLLYRQLKARRAADVETQVRSAIRMIRSLSYPAYAALGPARTRTADQHLRSAAHTFGRPG